MGSYLLSWGRLFLPGRANNSLLQIYDYQPPSLNPKRRDAIYPLKTMLSNTPMSTKCRPLEHRHTWHQITPRLGAISQASKSGKKQTLVAVYCGFCDSKKAADFACWIVEHWGKNPEHDVSLRPAKRLEGQRFEVKIRKPTLQQLHALINKATKLPANVLIFERKSS